MYDAQYLKDEKNAMKFYQLCLVGELAAGITFLAIVLSSIIKYA